jgi:hypothetical protein
MKARGSTEVGVDRDGSSGSMGESGSRWKQVDESRRINGSRCEAVGSDWTEALEVLVGNKDSGPSLQKASELHHAF